MEEYKSKLFIRETVIPDPLTLKDGWLEEKEAMQCWPQLYFCDITEYLRLQSPAELYQRVCTEYKEGKAYRYDFPYGFIHLSADIHTW